MYFSFKIKSHFNFLYCGKYIIGWLTFGCYNVNVNILEYKSDCNLIRIMQEQIQTIVDSMQQ